MLAVSALAVIYASRQIVTNRVSGGFAVEQLAIGSSSFAIMQSKAARNPGAGGSEDPEVSCVGIVNILVEDEELLRFRMEATLAMAYGGVPQSLRIISDMFFNPLGQLIRSRSQFTLGGLRAELSTQDVHPVRVEISAGSSGTMSRYAYRIPGPILVRANKPTGYVFEYPQLQSAGPVPLPDAFGDLASETKLALEPLVDTSECDESKRSSIDLSAAASRVRRLIPRLQKLVPSRNMGS